MFWGKKSEKEEGKLAGPGNIPDLIQKHLVTEWKMNPDLVNLLKALLRRNPKGEKSFHVRIFDELDAKAKKVQVKDYTSLDERPDLIIYEGQFDEGTKQVKLEEKKKVIWDVPLSTQEEIQKKIEALREAGSSVFFYMARGVGAGGPLGMGAAIIELNPSYPEKKQKKYIVYSADVIDMQPVGKGQRLFDSDKTKEIARWTLEGHHKRMY